MLLERYLENLNKKIRIVFAYKEHSEGIKKLKELDNAKYGWIGSFSVSSRNAKVYSISEPAIIWEGTILIGTEIAKLLLLLNKPPSGYRKITAQQLEETPPPLYAEPCQQMEAVYLDIKRCYYHLITRLWGVKYARGQWLGWDMEIGNWHVPEEIEDILETHKTVRNAIYGIMRAKVRVIWKEQNGKIVYSVQKTKNELFYPDIPLAILDITHAIAKMAVEKFDAKYVAIDGFILPHKNAKKFKEWLEELGFQVGVRAEGEAIIKNYYTYKVGKLQTQHFHIIPEARETQSNLIFTLDEAQEILRKFAPFLTHKK